MTFRECDVDEFCSGGFLYLHHKPSQHLVRREDSDLSNGRMEALWSELQQLVEREP